MTNIKGCALSCVILDICLDLIAVDFIAYFFSYSEHRKLFDEIYTGARNERFLAVNIDRKIMFVTRMCRITSLLELVHSVYSNLVHE